MSRLESRKGRRLENCQKRYHLFEEVIEKGVFLRKFFSEMGIEI